jgi:hypothetical protein
MKLRFILLCLLICLRASAAQFTNLWPGAQVVAGDQFAVSFGGGGGGGGGGGTGLPTATLQFYYETTNISLADNTPFGTSVWLDQSGNGRNASNGAGSSAYYENNASYWLNGRPALFCFGSDVLLTNSLSAQPPVTVFCVCKQVSGGLFSIFDGGAGNTLKIYVNGNKVEVDKAGAVVVANSGTFSSGNHVIVVTLDTSGNYAFYIDSDSANGTGTSLQTYNAAKVMFGSASGSYYLYSIGAYNTVLSGSDRTALVNYLKGEFGL